MSKKNPFVKLEENSIVVRLTELEDLKDAVDLIKETGLTDCKIYLGSSLSHGGNENRTECVFIDNISYLEELDKMGLNINFYYFDDKEKGISLKKVIEFEKKLDLMCKKIKDSDLSPLEKFIGIYDIVNFFKPYKEENEVEMSSTLSRNLYEYLDNDYMVCVGYADLLQNLCIRVGIPCIYYTLESLNKGKDGHARNYVYINDPKYNINGFYISDATQQEQIENIAGYPISNWKNMLITTEEQQKEKLYELDNCSKIFSKTKDEFMKQAEMEGNYMKFLVAFYIKKFDTVFGEEIYNMNFDNSADVEKTWNYISSKINKPISKEILLNALMETKKVLYPNISEATISDLKMFYSRKMDIEQEMDEILNISKMTLNEIKLQHPIYYNSEIFYVINTNLKNNSCDNLSIVWKKEIESLKAFGFPTPRILTNQDKIINQGYQIDFNERGQINIQFPLLSNREIITLEEYITLLNKQIQDFSSMVSSLSQQDNNIIAINDEVETQKSIHTEKENANTRISLWKKIKALFAGKKNKKQAEAKQIEIPKQETNKRNDEEYIETINTQQYISTNSYLSNNGSKADERYVTEHIPVNIDEMSKEQLEELKKQLEEEYSIDKPQGFIR